MVKFVIGILLGFTLTIWYVVFDLNYDFDSSIAVNIVIASATAMAAAIHFDEVKKKRKDRIWEINRIHLLNLSKSLSEVIEVTELEADYEFEKMQQIPTEKPKGDYSEKYKAFTKSLNDSLTIYEPMLADDIIEKIESFKTKNNNIDHAYEHGHISSLFEVYGSILGNQMELHRSLSEYIKNIAGTKNT